MATEETKDTAEELNQESAEPVEEVKDEAKAEETAKEESKKDKKKYKGDKELEAAKAKIAELEDKNIRQMAEFQNFRNRTDKEKALQFDMGAKCIIEKILPVVDNFERGLATLTEEEKAGAFAEGMNKVYKQLTTELDNLGVKAIDAKGKEFDPNLHNAVMHIDDDSFGENVIVEEFQKGYKYRDGIVRHSMVKVAN